MLDDGCTRKDSRPTRVAVVGAGAFGVLHARAFAAASHATLAAIIDSDENRALQARAAVGAQGESTVVSTDLVHALDTADIDAVSIVVGGDQRVNLALDAIAAGCSVLVEKPVALRAEDARRVARAAEERGVVAMPAHVLRFAAPYQQVRDAIRDGEVGQLRTMTFHRHRGRDHDVKYGDLHPVLMTMIHDIDLAFWYTGEAGEAPVVEEATARHEPGRRQPRAISARVRFPTGATATFETSWSLEPGDDVPDLLTVTGDEGIRTLDLGVLRAQGVSGIGPDSAWLTPPDGGGALGLEVDAFLRLVRGEAIPVPVTMADATAGLALATQIIEASASDEGRAS